MTGHEVTAETEIHAPRSKVWRALTDPEQIQRYMFGSRVETDWKPGSRITWKGEYEGKKYEDKGEILEVVQERPLKVTYFSQLSGRGCAGELPHAAVRAEGERRQNPCLVEPGQQPKRGGRRALAGELGEDVRGAQGGRRGRFLARFGWRQLPGRACCHPTQAF